MSEPPSFELPSQVRERDGKVVPFDPDRICQAIYLATEALGQPSAFLAREMTDGVLHFLAQEYAAGPPSTEQIAETIAKVLRELGQPNLALAFEQRSAPAENEAVRSAAAGPNLPLFADHSFAGYLDACRRLFSLHAVYSRDLRASQDEGFLILAGLEHPAELAGGVLPWTGADEQSSLLAKVLDARRRFGGFIALDGPEFTCDEATAASWAEQLRQGMEATGLRGIVNLNAAEPPPWAGPSGQGPLFQAAPLSPPTPEPGLDSVRLSLLEALLEQSTDLRIDWHLSARDFASGTDAGLTRIVQAACQGRSVSFVFDRSGAAVALAEGVDRRHPAVLQTVGVNLARLADIEDLPGNPDHFLARLLHLAQMALSAGVQKRRFLKLTMEQHARPAEDLRRGFFLDRARLTVVPVGLPAVVQRLAGQGVGGKQGLLVARQIVDRLGQCLVQAGRSVNLDAVLDSPWWNSPQPGSGPFFSQPHLVGLTSADFAASAEDQLRAAGTLQQPFGTGTATLLLPQELACNAERLMQLLHFAWKKTSLARLRLAAASGLN